jgi:outer membrane receptor protein involved in Fe transport
MRSLFLQAAYAVPDGNGNAVCGPDATNPNLTAALRQNLDAFRALNPTAVCVPFNIFGYGSPSDAAWDYISGAGLQSRQTALSTQHVGSVQVNGTPFNTWAGPVSVAFGAETRRDHYSITADAATVARLWASSLTTPFSGTTKVTEGFAELGVPLMKDSAFGTALDLNGAIRRTHYSTSGSVVTWKLGATYSPIEALKLRVTRSRDIRAPDNIELFQAGTVSQVPNFLNPINGTTGLTSTTTQGNKNLKPEVAKTWTLGVVATPGGALKGFQAAFDYYSIDVGGVIGTNLATDIAQRCAQGIQVFCDQIVFDNSPLGIATILLQPINFNRLKTRGFDIDLSYRTTFGKSRMEIRGLVNHVIELSTTDGSGTIDRAGSLQGNGVPAWTANATITYGVGNFEGMLGARYFSASRYDAALVGPDSAAYDPKLPNSINDNTFPSAVYLDLSLRQDVYQLGNTKVQIFGVVSNLLNKQPPFNSVLVNSGGNPFDLIGRSYRVGVRFSL